MSHFSSPNVATYAAQAQAIRNQFIIDSLRSIFTAPSIAKFSAYWREEQKIRKAMRELRVSSDRELADLGFARADIENVIRCRGEFSALPEVTALKLKMASQKTTKKSSSGRNEKLPMAA